ncbi:MAG: hypothetical protein IRZ13_09035 [Acetobacteraceae bacterium]|nr:hypothetical protein [Acetobacteraceae bacterium]
MSGAANGKCLTGIMGISSAVQLGGTTSGRGPGTKFGSADTGSASSGGSATGSVKRGGS